MADFPTKGISEEELGSELEELLGKYKVADEEFHLYEDWTSQIRDMAKRGSNLEKVAVTETEADTLFSNQTEHFRKLLNLMKIHERVKLLYELYEKYLQPDQERLEKLRDMLTHVEETHLRPYLEFFFNTYPETLKRAAMYMGPPSIE